MQVLISDNNVENLLNKIQEYIDGGGNIKSVYLVDKTDDQVIVLVDEKKISKEAADAWWCGWTSALTSI